MAARREAYAERALPGIARLLTFLDRNPLSPTYGCFHRDYWLYKTSDFPDQVRQFAALSLALVYRHDFPGNVYKGRDIVREWTVASLEYWARSQHSDGSFDEFYPFERGWSGPTAFITYSAAESLILLEGEVPAAAQDKIMAAIERAARFLAQGDREGDTLANHHATTCAALWKTHKLTGDQAHLAAFERAFEVFLGYHDSAEGWSLEYDGVDPGYLTATVSFLAKIYQDLPDIRIREVMEQSAEFCSYFVFPDGHFSGNMGSRNTQHFYSHGFEVLAGTLPIAAAVAERTLKALEDGSLVPPEIMSDRYVDERIPELLQSYVDYSPRGNVDPLPFERDPFTEYFPKARVFASCRGGNYVVANLAKGGVVKVFDRYRQRLLFNDGGALGQLDGGPMITTQWISPDYECSAGDDGFQVSGRMQGVPSNKVFTLFRNLLFRGVLLLLGWNSGFCHFLKARIRAVLIQGRRSAPVTFQRRLNMDGDRVTLTDEYATLGTTRLTGLSVGGEFFVRYVPQSRFFQAHEMDSRVFELDDGALARLNAGDTLKLTAGMEDGWRLEAAP